MARNVFKTFFCMFHLLVQFSSPSLSVLEHIIETDYHPPPVADFGYGRGGVAEGYRDTFESWETNGASGGYSMNAMFADGGLQTDYEMSNINSVSMTPNGKYAIVGQSQGPPQIWDAIVRRKRAFVFRTQKFRSSFRTDNSFRACKEQALTAVKWPWHAVVHYWLVWPATASIRKRASFK